MLGCGRQVSSRTADQLTCWQCPQFHGLTSGPLRSKGSGACAKPGQDVSPPPGSTSPGSRARSWTWHPQDRQQMEPGLCPFSQVVMWPSCHAHGCCKQPCALERERTPVVALCVLPHKPSCSALLQAHSRTRRGHHCSRILCVNRWEGQEAAVPSTIGGAKGDCCVGVQPGAVMVSRASRKQCRGTGPWASASL